MESGNFIAKPPRGWLHSDKLVAEEGITYSVRYIGCIQVYTSMRSLDFDTRSQVAKQCINRVCEAAKVKISDRKRKVDKRVLRAIGEKPNLEHAGTNVNLTVSSACLTLRSLDRGQFETRHDMPRISFACGGDSHSLEFVAYVAKDLREWRACYVLECGTGLAQEVITTIGQAFELRFKQYLQNPLNAGLPGTQDNPIDTRDYYNDLPGKVPPDVGPPPVPPLPNTHQPVHSSVVTPASHPETKNLIDLRMDDYDPSCHDYVNTQVVDGASSLLIDPVHPEGTEFSRLSPSDMRRILQTETWFHGCVSRQEAESLLTKDGEFLVRESLGSPGQYVLTGMQGGFKKHLLLIDPEGSVRTKDRVFENVSHLVNYHVVNQVPIISAESALVLRYPVNATRPAV